MHWIIQSNLVGAEDVARLRDALLRLNTPFDMVKLIPIVRQLEHVPVVEGPVFVYGSTFVHRSAYGHGWSPGYVGGMHDYEEVLKHYGTEMLNSDVQYIPLKDLKSSSPVFIRPRDDGKLFTGLLVDADGLDELRAQVLGHAGTENVLDEVVVVSSPKKIFAEHRCLVVDGKVVTASTYRRGGKLLYDGRVDEAILNYAQSQIDIWNPDLGCAIDIAETPDGLKIIEINALSSSGLYACDLIKFVSAVNQLGQRPVSNPALKNTI